MALLNANPANFLQNLKKQPANALAATQAGISSNNVFSGVPGAQGMQAKSPEQNIKPVTNTIQSNQVKTPTQAQSTPFSDTQNTGLMAALQRQKSGTVTGEDVKNINYAQSKGWSPINATNTQTNNQITPTVAAPKPTDISSKGILTSLTNTAQTGSPTAQAAQTGLLGTAAANPATTGQAYKDYQTAIDELANLKSSMAQAEAGISSTGIPLEFQQGRSQVLNKQYADQLQAAQEKVNQAQNAISQQITGAQTQQAGYSQAGTLGQTGQGLVQSGLGTVAGYVQPQQVPYGTPLVTPQTGQVVGGTGTTAGEVAPTDPFYKTLQSYAQLLASNQGSAIPSSITGNSVLNAQLIKMAQQINPNFNVNVASGAGGAQQNVAAAQAAQIENNKSNLQQAKNVGSQLSDLINTFGLNPSNVNAVNAGLQKIATNFSDPNYQSLNNYISSLASLYGQILTPAGGNPTDSIRDTANRMLNSTMSGQGLQSVIATLDQEANARIAGVSTAGGLGGGSNVTPTGNALYNW